MRHSFFLLLWLCPGLLAAQSSALRAPSYPLITHDPYFSIWINDEVPTNTDASHWTQVDMPIRCMVSIDGEPFRLMGKSPAFVPAAAHTSTSFSATQTHFLFEQNGVSLDLGFLSPLLVDDLDLVSRPLSYVQLEASSLDGEAHELEWYIDISGYACIDQRGQKVTWQEEESNDLSILRMGTQDQPILKKKGDNVRIDWGYLYLAAQKEHIAQSFIGRSEVAMDAFAADNDFPAENIHDQNHRFINYEPVLAMTMEMELPASGSADRHVMMAYDDIFSVEYFEQQLEGYWKRYFDSMKDLLATAEEEYPSILERCHAFDQDMHEQAVQVGGEPYAAICNLAYRQCMAAHKIVKDENDQPLCFSKENFSNGSMGTVDVFYPASPYFLLFNVDLMKAQTTPIFDYAISGRWPWPYAPHDIGKYPIGNGQTYGGGEDTENRQMPVEECGNMLIMAAAIARVEGNADYATGYWDIITQWAEYLKEKGFDPDNQLCTDDFAGHLAHNANLSIKAIMGIASYAMLCEMRGMEAEAEAYMSLAKQMVMDWKQAAQEEDHYRLAFDQAGSWSQKYNMIWDELLGFDLFDEEMIHQEISYYLTVQNRYGLALDSRESYTKLDWILWTASLASSREAFDQLIAPVYRFLHETPDRVPMSDWYWTQSGEMRGFVARSVVGGVFMEMLKDALKE